MSQPVVMRNYSLSGPEGPVAVNKGLAEAQWYQCPIPRKRMKELMQRKDGPAIRDTILWFGLMAASGYLGYHYWGTWKAIPWFLVYGVIYGSSADSRWHECGHRTAFKTTWMNDVVYYIASFMVLRNPELWRWSHTRHHTDTIVVGRDPEIAVPRPPNPLTCIGYFFGIPAAMGFFRTLPLHVLGRLSADEITFVPHSERGKVYWAARVYLLIILGALAGSLYLHSILPLMYIFLPSFYGAWLAPVWGFTQHAGLAEDVLDHRLNCRTVYMNPVIRYLYWNMNYHVEHHMFPLVPYHALPALHEEMKNDCPPAYKGLWEAWSEIVPAVLRQIKDPTYYVRRELPKPVPADVQLTAAVN